MPCFIPSRPGGRHVALLPRLSLALLASVAGGSCGETPVVSSAAPASGAAPRPDVIVVAFDGLGPGHVASLSEGPTLAVTPGLDRLVAEGAVYLDAYAPSPWAGEALAAALTGRVRPGGLEATESTPTLAEHLAHLGYRTALFAGHTQHLLCADAEANGEDPPAHVRGFQAVQRPAGADTAAGARADDVADAAIDWLLADSAAALLVVTLADPRPPHHLYAGLVPAADVPYEGPVLAGLGHAELLRRGPSFDADDLARLAELHASEVAMADRAFSRIVDAAQGRGGTSPTIVAVGLRAPALGSSALGSSALGSPAGRFGLVPSLDPSELRVPLIARFPGPVSASGTGARGEVSLPVSLVDLTPTLLDALGFEPRRDIDGRSVLPGALWPDRDIVAATTRGIRGATLIGADAAVGIDLDADEGQGYGRDAGRWLPTDTRDARLTQRLTAWLRRAGLPTGEALED